MSYLFADLIADFVSVISSSMFLRKIPIDGLFSFFRRVGLCKWDGYGYRLVRMIRVW